MNPIDETWEARSYVLVVTNREDAPYIIGRFAQWEPDIDHEEARAKLAAEAPLMARMLRSLEWVGDGGGTPVCGSCNIAKYGPGLIENEHYPDCAWLALMRRIGERP
jgi:hypothetical protein